MNIKKEQIQILIKELIKQGYSKADIARGIDVAEVTLYRYEAGKIDNPHRRVLKNLELMLGEK